MPISLNEQQQQAVNQTEGAVLVLSGAGTGKTRVLTARLAHIIASGLARPWECLAVTFTNRAAREMEERLANMIGADASQVWLGTFHSIGLKILRRFASELGYAQNFVILGEDDQTRLIKQIMLSEGYDIKKYTPEAVLAAIQTWKDKGISPGKVLTGDRTDFMSGRVLGIYRMYQDRLKSMNAMDFGDLLMLCLELFARNPEILAKYQNQFRYIMVDEYQDTNTAQYLWLRLLAQKWGNLCCVGDDDQSIYSWRGAQIGNILKFDHDFKDAKIIRLESNYRSTAHILAAASGIIRHNEGRLGKELRVAPNRDPDGEKVKVKGLSSGREEALAAVDSIENAYRHGTPYSQMAILVRTTAQTREFEEAFITNAIPYQVIGGAKFYEREEIRDAIAYLRAVALPSDDMAIMRIINKPRRGIGDTTIDLVRQKALKENLPFFAALKDLSRPDSFELKPAAKKAAAAFLQSHALWTEYAEKLPPFEALKNILDNAGYIAMWQESNDIKAEGKLENLTELLSVLKQRFDSIHAFLEHIALISDTDEIVGDDKVSIMTLHSAKGLEFDMVILAGWEEGLFPHQRALDETGNFGLEEERRLAYVGITRARKNVYITYAANRMVFGQWQTSIPSRFLEELPVADIEILGLPSSFKSYSNYTPKIYKPIDPPPPPKKQSSKSGLRVGIRVKHALFGYGVIMKIDGEKLTVLFENGGKKNILASFVTPA